MTSYADICSTVSPNLKPTYAAYLPPTASSAPPSLPSQTLEAERSRSTLDTDKLHVFLAGSAEAVAAAEAARQLVADAGVSDPRLTAGLPGYSLSRAERVANAHARQAALIDAVAAAGLDVDDPEVLLGIRGEIMDGLPSDLQWIMFTPNIEMLFDDAQVEKWLPLARSYGILGAYAQTELGHGSNVRGLETTATFDAQTDEFVIHTPSLTALKWWPGCLGKTANYAVVYARLVLGDTDYGIHNFLVQLRDPDTHQLLPGVTTGDIGPKLGYNNQDNGWAAFDSVRIPRDWMAMRYAKVTRSGQYVPPDGTSRKLLYLSMLGVRAWIVRAAGRELSKAITIAVRYSSVRLQGFKNPKAGGAEFAVLDYSLQQYRLFPLLAGCYVMNSMAGTMKDLHASVLASIDEGSSLALLPDLHATSSGLKSVCSSIAAAGIKDARLSCGGHGFLSSSGFPDLETYYTHTETVEGDNYMITQQTTRYLLKVFTAAASDPSSLDALSIRFAYIHDALAIAKGTLPPSRATSSGSWSDPATVVAAHAHRAAYALARLARSMQDLVVSQGMSQGDAWRASLIEIHSLAWAHALYVLVQNHFAVLDAPSLPGDLGAPEVDILSDLGLLFGLHQIELKSGEFLEDGYLSADDMVEVRSTVRSLLLSIRPHAVSLVDAFGHTDDRLGSALGRQDGDVYRALFVASSYSSLNKDDPSKTYVESLRKMMADGRKRAGFNPDTIHSKL